MDNQTKMEHSRWAKLTPENLLDGEVMRWDGRTSVPNDLWTEIRQRLDRLVRYEAALKVAPHPLDCPSLHETHLPGLIHYETDAGEPCPAYHFRRGKCNCYHAALEDR